MSIILVDTLDADGNRITNLPAPAAGTDPATRDYVDTEIAGIDTGGALTTEDVQDTVGAMLVEGGNIDIVYNDAAGTITISVEALTSADLSDFTTAVRAALSVSDTLTVDLSYSGGVISATVLDSPTVGGYTPANLRDRSTHTGTQSADTLTDGTTNKAFLATERTKLAGIATGATANSSDATLLNRANHTGTQTAATISDFATAAVTAVNAGTIDADTLGGSSKAQIISDAIAGVVDSAPGTLDTLNELAAALGDDPNFATTVTTALAARTQKYTTTVGNGTNTSFTVTHNLGSRAVVVQVYDSTTYEEVWASVARPTTNTVSVGFSTAPASGAYTVVVIG